MVGRPNSKAKNYKWKASASSQTGKYKLGFRAPWATDYTLQLYKCTGFIPTIKNLQQLKVTLIGLLRNSDLQVLPQLVLHLMCSSWSNLSIFLRTNTITSLGLAGSRGGNSALGHGLLSAGSECIQFNQSYFFYLYKIKLISVVA